MGRNSGTMPTSEHFRLERLADGVYVAVLTPQGAAYCNAGIIDLGDQTLIFDTCDTPQAAEDLRSAAESLTGRPATYVINSHAHADHWCGNQVFADHATIISSHSARDAMPDSVAWLLRCKDDPSLLETTIEEGQERLRTEVDGRWRTTLETLLARWGYLLQALPTLDIRLPHETFAGKLVFHGTERRAELIEVAPGHSTSDSYLLLPAERIMFMGDLGFVESQPVLAFGDPQPWKAFLRQVESSDIEVLVPGHGHPGTKADIGLQRRFLSVVVEMVGNVIEAGGSVADALEQTLPSPFDAWLDGTMHRWEANIESQYGRLSSQSAR